MVFYLCDVCCRYDETKHHVTTSYSLYVDLVQFFHRLYEKEDDQLSEIERELKYFHPDADQWYLGVDNIKNPDSLLLAKSTTIVKFRMLKPEGLNSDLSFQSREHWYEFAAWYKEFHKKKMRERGRGEGGRDGGRREGGRDEGRREGGRDGGRGEGGRDGGRGEGGRDGGRGEGGGGMGGEKREKEGVVCE